MYSSPMYYQPYRRIEKIEILNKATVETEPDELSIVSALNIFAKLMLLFPHNEVFATFWYRLFIIHKCRHRFQWNK